MNQRDFTTPSFPEPYEIYNEFFKDFQIKIFDLKSQIEVLINSGLFNNHHPDITNLEKKIDTLERLAFGDIEMALFEDEADEKTKITIRRIATALLSYEAYLNAKNKV